MKEIILIGSYCNTQIKLDILEKQIDSLKLLNIDILVFGRYPLPSYIQKRCAYFRFDKYNPIIENRTLYHYLHTHGQEINYVFEDYGYAALEQIIKSLGFAKSLNYDIAHWLVYDVDVTEFNLFRLLSLEKLSIHDVVCSKFQKTNDLEQGIDGCSLSFKIHTAYDKLKGNMTKTFYKDLIKRKNKDFISEDFMEECFRVSEIQPYIVSPKPNLPAVLSSTKNRQHGEVPLSLKSSKYFKRCFVGWDLDKGCCVIWMDNILIDITKIKLQLDKSRFLDKKTIINKNGGIEIIPSIDDPLVVVNPKMLKIISINEEVIDEILDIELTNEYYKVNTIKNKL